MEITLEQKKRLLDVDNFKEFQVMLGEVYKGTPMLEYDPDVLKHLNTLFSKQGRENGEDIQIPSDPREAFVEANKRRSN